MIVGITMLNPRLASILGFFCALGFDGGSGVGDSDEGDGCTDSECSDMIEWAELNIGIGAEMAGVGPKAGPNILPSS